MTVTYQKLPLVKGVILGMKDISPSKLAVTDMKQIQGYF